MEDRAILSVADLKRELANWSDDTEVIFCVSLGDRVVSDDLCFNRFKGRGEKLLQIQLYEDTPIQPL